MARGRSLWQFFRHSRNSDLIVILGEDIAALAGLAVALAAVSAALLTGNPVFDAAGSIVVGALLILVAVLLVIEIKGLITGQSAEPEVEQAIRGFILARPEVAELFHMITLQMGEWNHACGEGADARIAGCRAPARRRESGGSGAAASFSGPRVGVLRAR